MFKVLFRKQLMYLGGVLATDVVRLEEISLSLGYKPSTIPLPEDLYKIEAAQSVPPTQFIQCSPVSGSCSDTTYERSLTVASTQDLTMANNMPDSLEPLDDSAYTYLLAHCLGGSIPDPMLRRIESAQLRWDDEGELTSLTPPISQLDKRLLELSRVDYSTSDKIDEASQGWVVAVAPSLDQSVMDREKQRMYMEALRWICFTFPRVESEEPQYFFLTRLLLPRLFHALQNLTQVQLPRDTKQEVAELLLVASAVPDCRAQSLTILPNYLDGRSPLHLRAELALQQSISWRLQGNYDQSEHVLHEFCCRCQRPLDGCLPQFFRSQSMELKGRARAVHGLLHRSHLENLVQQEQYDLAEQQIADWDGDDVQRVSRMERSTVPSRTLTSCKIYRSKGNFEVAKTSLELCLRSLNGHESFYPQIVCQLLDTYSDLELPASGSLLILNTSHCRDTKRMLVSELDIHIQNQHYTEAMDIIEKLQGAFGGRISNISDELLHIRVLIAVARVRYCLGDLNQALEDWQTVLDHVQRYVSFRGEGFTYAVVHLSLSLTHLELNEREEAENNFLHGRRILKEKRRDYWVPTLPIWMKFITEDIHGKAGWTL